MDCASCGSDIPAAFSHAIRKNECPACGQAIMDEEALALLDDLRGCVSSAVRLRDESVERIALAVLASYDLAPKSERPPLAAPRPQQAQQRQHVPTQRPQQAPAKPMTRAQVAAMEEGISEEDLEDGIVQVADLADPSFSEEERAAIMEERVAAKFQMTPASRASTTPEALQARVARPVGQQGHMSDSELLNNPVLEAQRLQRLQRQEANMAAGAASVRRSDD